jgi:hypothetical protein
MRAFLSLFIAALISAVSASLLYPREFPGYPGLCLSRPNIPLLQLTFLRRVRTGLLGQCHVYQMSTRRSPMPVRGPSLRQRDEHMLHK